MSSANPAPISHRYPTRFSLNKTQHLLPPPDTLSPITLNPSIFQLPDEILQLILSNFSSYDQGTLSSFGLASKHFYSLSYPRLWSWLRLIRSEDEIHARDHTSHRAALPSELKNAVQRLTIGYHSTQWCYERSISTQALTTLTTLELVIDPHSIDSGPFHDGISCEYRPPQKECYFLQKVQPRNLIIRNSSTCELHLGDKSINPEVWTKVQTLIMVSPASEPFYTDLSSSLCYPSQKHLEELKRIFWVFDPTNDALPLYPYKQSREGLFVNMLIDLIIEYCDVEITLVNTGSTGNPKSSVDGGFNPKAYAEQQKEVEGSIRGVLALIGGIPEWSAEKLKNSQQTLRFQTLREFLAEEKWDDWFDWKEMERWKGSMKGLC